MFNFSLNIRTLELAGVCLREKLRPFSDISQNSTLEKRTLHRVQHAKNGLCEEYGHTE